ncbi:DUF6042 family protein [Streptomyces mexicanus]|jgi:hypothetical protein|uniref:Uncharacterized protein n=1 Tax=Streptomyces mexicanus TaxID=178566 RepID=A0A7X1LUP4_9ACTN|nr:DUF6042 family protein [Streptomyces mexicanus]MBC2868616.1 hypothetical protein [Streptomyces mexicanus]
MTTVPLTNWSHEQQELHLRSVVRGGWLRIPPNMTGLLLIGLGCEGRPLTREEARTIVRTWANPRGDWQASCWDQEDKLERDEDDLADLRKQQADAARYAAHYGLPPLRTFTDLLGLLIAAGVVHEIRDARGVPRLHPAFPLPGPHEVFPLDEEELAVQKSLRRDAAYGSDSYRIIDLFAPTGERRNEIITSLDRLARTIEGHSHDAREAVQLLLEAGDFSATEDISCVASHKVFRLHCDWRKFDAQRIGIGRDDQGRIEVTLPANPA